MGDGKETERQPLLQNDNNSTYNTAEAEDIIIGKCIFIDFPNVYITRELQNKDYK